MHEYVYFNYNIRIEGKLQGFFTLILLKFFAEWGQKEHHCLFSSLFPCNFLKRTVSWLQRFGVTRKLLYIGHSSQFFHPVSSICLPVKFFDFKEVPQSYRLLRKNVIIFIIIIIPFIQSEISYQRKCHQKNVSAMSQKYWVQSGSGLRNFKRAQGKISKKLLLKSWQRWPGYKILKTKNWDLRVDLTSNSWVCLSVAF